MINNEKYRQEWVEKQLKRIPAGSRILDAGAGEQQYRKFCSHLQYVSQDFAAYDPEQLKTGLQMNTWDYGKLDIISDILSIPEPDQSFDAILCTEVFEHIPEPVAALHEFSRLLKRGGKLILTAPFTSMTHFAPYYFATGFSGFFYEHHLPKAGMAPEEISFNGNYFDFLSQELKRVDHIAIGHANDKPRFLEYRALKIVRKMMERFSSKGNSSASLLTLGVHVVATKL